ncbi:GTP-binding protein [Prochlorococcus sp. MIT 1223]|uniref:YcjF family protein n=1 Tax=Prochlorococcus sp. MIT 1223 TaxID=3096217 RepID=UPI002A74AEBB|nr:GTP-binding protein [Prochlorococcus sp. MIT 1223]
MMTRKKLIILIAISFPFFLVIAGIIGALIRLINLQTLFITSILILIFSKKLKSPIINKILSFTGSNRKRNHLNLFLKTKKEAAIKSIESIDRLIARIHNKVEIEGLRQERDRVKSELSRGDLNIVVFGTGSSGKTSLIRALLNEIVGNVGPSMGSTTNSNSYRLRLKGLRRGIQITDTPGILEGGKNGRFREREALIKASRADLMIVVIDTDLREAEFEIIDNLSKVGKRLFLVLNKIDLRGIKEEQQLLAILRARTKGLIKSEDIIATTASPQSIPKPGKSPIQPLPEIDNLVRRLAKVLYEEGEELLSDNILLQCKSLGNIGKNVLNKQRELSARKSVDKYSWISSGVVAITPLPGVELLGAAAVNAQMVIEIAKVYGIEITRARAKDLALSVAKTLTGLGIVQGGLSAITSALSMNVPGFIVTRAIQSVTAAWLTRVAGESFITYFQQDQDWGDGGIQEVVQHQYDLNRREETLSNFINLALRKVVTPLRNNLNRQLPPHQRPRGGEEA